MPDWKPEILRRLAPLKLSPRREAEIADPQQRIFLECASEALERAGYSPERFHGRIGVYGGENINTYFLINLLSNPAAIKSVGAYQLLIGNDKDFLSTMVSYKLNLTGPSITVQCACSCLSRSFIYSSSAVQFGDLI